MAREKRQDMRDTLVPPVRDGKLGDEVFRGVKIATGDSHEQAPFDRTLVLLLPRWCDYEYIEQVFYCQALNLDLLF